MKSDETGTLPRKGFGFQAGEPLPGLLVVYAPQGVGAPSHWTVDDDRKITVGRAEGCDLRIMETSLSRLHFGVKIDRATRAAILADGGSKNGTYVDGRRAVGLVPLEDGTVIRAGRTLMVYCADLLPLLRESSAKHPEIVGRFHGSVLISELKEAATAGRNALLTGPSGSGKELAARALAEMAGRPLVAHNAARFSSEEEAATSLFGVGTGVFTNVKDRPGLIERADGGVLFLDEAHVLPERVQKSLLRVLEDGRLSRFGHAVERKVDVRFVLASNEPPDTYGLAHDLRNRLMEVKLPPLKERVADIPSIFDHLVTGAFDQAGLDPPKLSEILDDGHYEALMLDGFERDNVRGLKDIADRIAARVKTGAAPRLAVDEIFAWRYPAPAGSPAQDPRGQKEERGDDPRPGSCREDRLTAEIMRPVTYETEDHRQVREAFIRVGNNAAAIERDLKARGVIISRRRIGVLMDEMRIPRVRRG